MSEAPNLSRTGWRKSTFSNGQGGDCIECAWLPGGGIAVRDSKLPEGTILRVSHDQWRAFTERVKRGAAG
jgi:hypothetical protein